MLHQDSPYWVSSEPPVDLLEHSDQLAGQGEKKMVKCRFSTVKFTLVNILYYVLVRVVYLIGHMVYLPEDCVRALSLGK